MSIGNNRHDSIYFYINCIFAVHTQVLLCMPIGFYTYRKRFIEGEDFFSIPYSEFSTKFVLNSSKGGNPNVSVILVTKSGYLMLVKSFTDDLAWDVQRQLVNNYFNSHQIAIAAYSFPVAPAALESATNAGRLLERIMKSEGAEPFQIAMAVRSIFHQAGINIPSYVVKIPTYEQLSFDVSVK